MNLHQRIGLLLFLGNHFAYTRYKLAGKNFSVSDLCWHAVAGIGGIVMFLCN